MKTKNLDIVYVVKKDDNNEELRYSLRSLANLPHKRVWVYGYKPSWVGNVLHIPVTREGAKWGNTANMLQLAAANDNITDDFILFNDDFFVMKPTTELPVWFDRTLTTRANECRHGYAFVKYSRYGQQLLKASTELCRANKRTINYELHIPFVYNREKLLPICERYSGVAEGARRSLYGNIYSIGGRQHDDCKIYEILQEPDHDAQFLSTTDVTFELGRVGEYIRQQFQKPCIYERKGI